MQYTPVVLQTVYHLYCIYHIYHIYRFATKLLPDNYDIYGVYRRSTENLQCLQCLQCLQGFPEFADVVILDPRRFPDAGVESLVLLLLFIFQFSHRKMRYTSLVMLLCAVMPVMMAVPTPDSTWGTGMGDLIT